MEAAPGLWRTDLQQQDLSVPGREVVQTRVEITPNSPPIRHYHHGEEIICVLQGSLEYKIDGQPTRVCNAWDALTVPDEDLAELRRRIGAVRWPPKSCRPCRATASPPSRPKSAGTLAASRAPGQS